MLAGKIAARVIAVGALLTLSAVSWAAPSAGTAAGGGSREGSLPELRKEQGGVLIAREQVGRYVTALPPQLVELIERGDLVIDAVRTPQHPEFFTRRQGTEGAGQSESLNSGNSVVLDPQHGGLTISQHQISGPLFPTLDAGAGGAEQRRRAFQLLWNSASALWEQRSTSHSVALIVFREPNAPARAIDLRIERVYPQALGVKPGSLDPLFREKIAVVAPQVLAPLKWLTLRFLGAPEDYVWVTSPITGKTRQITGSNRSDLLFSGAVAPDELFVWSGKVELVEPTAVESVQVLVPVLEDLLGEEAADQKGVCRSLNLQGPGVLLNADSHRFAGVPGWVPTNVRFVLRKVWRIAMNTRDPFSLDARQELYVDALSQLPVYRAVWEPDGRLRRFTLGILGSVRNPADQTVRPTWAGQIVLVPADGSRSVLLLRGQDACSQFTPGRALEQFDPRAGEPRSDRRRDAGVRVTPTPPPQAQAPEDPAHAGDD